MSYTIVQTVLVCSIITPPPVMYVTINLQRVRIQKVLLIAAIVAALFSLLTLPALANVPTNNGVNSVNPLCILDFINSGSQNGVYLESSAMIYIVLVVTASGVIAPVALFINRHRLAAIIRRRMKHIHENPHQNQG